MATNLVAKMGQNYLPPALIALPFRNGIGYHNCNMRVNSVNDASILCGLYARLCHAFLVVLVMLLCRLLLFLSMTFFE